MKRVKRVLAITISIIISLIVILNVYSFVEIKVLHKDYAKINGKIMLEVISGSMEPTISIGDIIVVDTRASEYAEGDIITYYDTYHAIVTHRIIEIDDNNIICKGDANNTSDEPITKDRIIGKYSYRIKNLGRIISSLKSPFTLIMIFIVGVIVCVYMSIDKNGHVKLKNEEKEYMEFLDYKNKKKKR